METSRVTAKGQMTIPKRLRERCGIREGDTVMLEVVGDRIVLRKVAGPADDYLRGVEAGLGEWNSAEDEQAWRDL
jgi:antitoxin PrlF